MLTGQHFLIAFAGQCVLAGRCGDFKGACKPPVAQGPDKPSEAEKEEAQRWEREDVIAQRLLGQLLSDEIPMDMETYLTVKKQWDALTLIAMPKSAHAPVAPRHAVPEGSRRLGAPNSHKEAASRA